MKFKFHNDESGSATMDWVLMTIIVVTLGLFVMSDIWVELDPTEQEASP